MERERKGCLIAIVAIIVMATGTFIAVENDWLFLKNASMMLCTMICGWAGNTYFLNDEKKRTPKSHWKWYFLAVLILATLFTWIEKYIEQ